MFFFCEFSIYYLWKMDAWNKVECIYRICTHISSLKWKMFALKWGCKMFLHRGICVSELCLGHRSLKKKTDRITRSKGHPCCSTTLYVHFTTRLRLVSCSTDLANNSLHFPLIMSLNNFSLSFIIIRIIQIPSTVSLH